jgi:hypothetical protein
MKTIEPLQKRGMLIIYNSQHPSFGSTQCFHCGWEGIPTYWNGRVQTECPKCEGFPDELDLAATPLAQDLYIKREGVYVEREGFLRRWVPTRLFKPKQGRNELCACGSGRKYKRCCGA